MMKILFMIFLSTLFLWADHTPKTSEKSSLTAHEQQIITEAKIISQHYEEFIDTRPSKQKKRLAMTLKEEIETFQALYEGSPLIQPALGLLIEVDDYLDNTK